jgi:hypothetical protein
VTNGLRGEVRSRSTGDIRNKRTRTNSKYLSLHILVRTVQHLHADNEVGMMVELDAGEHGREVRLHDDPRAAQASAPLLDRVLLLLDFVALAQLGAGEVDLRTTQTVVLIARVLVQQVKLEFEAVLRDTAHDPFATCDAGWAGS